MDYTVLPLIAAVFCSLPVKVKSGPCFLHDCSLHGHLASCLTDPSNHWLCRHHESCQITMGRHETTLLCKSKEACNLEEDWNLCCSDPQCVLDHVAKRRRRGDDHHPHPPHAPPNCFSSFCDHHSDLMTCASGSYICHDNEFCDLHINRNDIGMACHPTWDHKYQECRDHEHRNHPDCAHYDPHVPHSDCRYCCHDADCITGLMTSSGGGHSWVTNFVPHPGKESCFTTDCDHHTNIHICLSGQWACRSDEYCKFEVHKNGDIHMQCRPLEPDLPKCMEEMLHHNPLACYNSSSLASGATDCHFCSKDSHGIHVILGIESSTTTALPTTTTTMKTTTKPTPTTKPTTALPQTTTPAPPTTTMSTTESTTPTTTTAMASTLSLTMTTDACHDRYMGDCIKDFSNMCSDPNVQKVCPKTCGICTPATSPPPVTTADPCVDTFMGNCSQVFPSLCHLPEVQNVCQKSCNACYANWTDCVDLHHGNCSEDFSAGLCVTSSVVKDVCRKTCGLCSASSSSPAPASKPLLSHSTTPKRPGQCIRCGDYQHNVPCTDLDLIMDTVTACDHPEHNLCMTDVIVDSNGKVATYKRCVDTQTCVDKWYLQTSDKHICLAFDPVVATSDITCHYCCVGNGCNTNSVPDHNKLWHP